MSERRPLPDPDASAGESADAELDLASAEGLLAAYLAGREEAFTRLVELEGGRLFGFLVRTLGDADEAEDVFQTVLVKVATHAADYDGRARFRTWLYRIARNAAIDAIRRRRRRAERSIEGGSGEEEPAEERFAADGPSPDAGALEAELGRSIEAAVAALPEEQREVFLLREEADLSFEEIGRLLGCGRETAKSRMRYALGHLRNALGAEARLYGLEPEG